MNTTSEMTGWDVGKITEYAGTAMELAGVTVIVAGAMAALPLAFARRADGGMYRQFRKGLGRSILLGLEFLVAADIIMTVAVHPTLANVGVLAVIVLIRTFLSFALELEIERRWPWQHRSAEDARGSERK